MGALTLAAREELDNLVFVVNCNLQRLDGPVRGNGKIVQELEAAFRGAGWNVIKVLWGDAWDTLLEKDKTGLLVKRMDEVIDGEYQRFSISGGDYIRSEFFGKYPELLDLVKNMSDEELEKLNRGGHDPKKVYAAFKLASETKHVPTVILAQTIKGYGLGESGEGKNITHQQKQLNEQELREFRSRFSIPISDAEVADAPFYKPPEDSEELKYMNERRKALGGYMPTREVKAPPIETPPDDFFKDFHDGTGEREVSTTMAFVQMLSKLMKDDTVGKYVVPIVPDEARTFGMEALFRQVGIYARLGQLYEPVDSENLLYYREAKDGQILEEGITEAGSMCSFIAAGTSYATHGINMMPFFIFYSMFGFQRIGDLIWAAGDMRAKGFMLGGTSGRTTLNGEGLQHQDGHSHLLAYPVPNLLAYDPTYAYELAVIIREGMYRMFDKQEDIFYYLTVMNETYVQPPMPKGCKEGILRGMYKFQASADKKSKLKANLFGSGTILNQSLEAAKILEEKYGVATDVYSVTSYKELYRDAIDVERENRLNPGRKQAIPYVGQLLAKEKGVFVAASDYVKTLPASIAKWIPGPFAMLGTDGYGRSDSRDALRNFFEVDERYIAVAALHELAQAGEIDAKIVSKAIKDLGIDPKKANPHNS